MKPIEFMESLEDSYLSRGINGWDGRILGVDGNSWTLYSSEIHRWRITLNEDPPWDSEDDLELYEKTFEFESEAEVLAAWSSLVMVVNA